MDIIKEAAVQVNTLFRALPEYGFTPADALKDTKLFINAHPQLCFKLPSGG